MANKQTVKREMQQQTGGGFINQNGIMKYLNCGKSSCLLREVIRDLPYIIDGRSHRYSIDDVAGRIVELYDRRYS